ncbi:MAG: xanthine dehydrogenase family protein molybdopterin-binding subunit [Hyphomicrobiaceae bacterium]
MSIGASLKRFEDERLLRGQGRYVEALRVDGCLEAVFVRSTVARGRIKSVDASVARAHPGVVAVMTGRDLEAAGVKPMKCRTAMPSADGTPFNEPVRHALAIENVRFVGEAVAIVVAETKAAALDAAEQVIVEIDDEAPVVTIQKSTETAFTWAHGDAAATAAAISAAPLVSRLTIVNNRIAPAPIEPRSAIARYDRATDSFDLTTQSQGVHTLRNAFALTLGIEPSKLRVQTFDVGGSFGLKLVPHPELVALLAAARAIGGPVRWVSTRSEAFLADNYARDHLSSATLALDRDGTFLGLDVETACNLGAYASSSAPSCMSVHFMRTLGHVYRIPVHHLTARGVYTNTAPTDVMRGAGKPEAHALIERLIDRAAREHGFDRTALRRHNLIRPMDLPRKTLSGNLIDSGDFPGTLAIALDRADWRGFAARRAQSEANGKRRGIGVALYMHVTSHPVEEHSRVALDADGRIAAAMGAQDIGQGHETTFAQLVAAEFDLDPAQVRVVQGDTAALPAIGAATGGSGSLQTSGTAVVRAARVLRERLREKAAALLEASAADLALDSGGFRITGTDRGVTIAALAQRMSEADREGCAGTAEVKGDFNTCPNGAYVAEVEIDPETGAIAIARFTGADDAGVRLNPMIVEGQLHGALAQGIGQALFERVVYDEDSGQLLTGSLMDYVLPLAQDLPRFDLVAADHPSTTHELGMKGVGECGNIGAPPAIMNAIADAIGHDRIEMPATPERVWRALNEKGS